MLLSILYLNYTNGAILQLAVEHGCNMAPFV